MAAWLSAKRWICVIDNHYKTHRRFAPVSNAVSSIARMVHHVSSNFASNLCNYIIMQTKALISIIIPMYITDL